LTPPQTFPDPNHHRFNFEHDDLSAGPSFRQKCVLVRPERCA
jgi:hypothetical protein